MTFSKQYNGKIHQANKKGEQSEREEPEACQAGLKEKGKNETYIE